MIKSRWLPGVIGVGKLPQTIGARNNRAERLPDYGRLRIDGSGASVVAIGAGRVFQTKVGQPRGGHPQPGNFHDFRSLDG